MPGQGYARSVAIRVAEVCCKELMSVDVTKSLTAVTTRSAAAPPAGCSGGYPHWRSRWTGTPRTRGAGGRTAPRIRGAGGRQLPGFDARTNKRGASEEAPRPVIETTRGVPENPVASAGGIRSRSCVSYPRSRSRWASAPRIRRAGGRQLSAFEEPVGASYPHSKSRWAPAIRIHGSGGRQLPAFREPVSGPAADREWRMPGSVPRPSGPAPPTFGR